MIDDATATERDFYWMRTLISDNVMLIGYLALAAFVGNRLCGWLGFGVTPWHLFAIGVAGAFTIWIGTIVVMRRARRRLIHGLRRNGFCEEEITNQIASLERPFWRTRS